jgi:hypothetical protein
MLNLKQVACLLQAITASRLCIVFTDSSYVQMMQIIGKPCDKTPTMGKIITLSLRTIRS